MEANPPPGMWAATGTVASKAPTLAEIRRGSFGSSGWNDEPQRYKAERRGSQGQEGATRMPGRTSSTQSGTPESPSRPQLGKGTRTGSSATPGLIGTEPFPAVTEEEMSTLPTRETAPVDGSVETAKHNGTEKEMTSMPMLKDNSLELDELPETGSRHPRYERQVRETALSISVWMADNYPSTRTATSLLRKSPGRRLQLSDSRPSGNGSSLLQVSL